jgi:hypothetical protein
MPHREERAFARVSKDEWLTARDGAGASLHHEGKLSPVGALWMNAMLP